MPDSGLSSPGAQAAASDDGAELRATADLNDTAKLSVGAALPTSPELPTRAEPSASTPQLAVEPSVSPALATTGAHPTQTKAQPAAPAVGQARWDRWLSWAQRRRRRLIALAVVLLVLALAVPVGMRILESIARQNVISQVKKALPGLSKDAVIDLGEESVLPQVWDGTLKHLEVTASTLEVNTSAGQGQAPTALQLNKLKLKLGSLQTDSPHTTQSFYVSGTITWDQLSARLAANLAKKSDSFPLGIVPSVTLSQGQDGTVRASMNLAGSTVSANVEPTITQEGDLEVTLSKVETSSLGFSWGLEDGINVLDWVGVPTTMTVLRAADLPAGLKLSSVTSETDGATVVLEGQNLALDSLH
ncbi:Uncharacterised protein [Actinomyces bovis]|uniref:DUF2993 domain-containing protein n=1 Tax=Actinomyces bovis TaxID=1658 RepID=A0ABY1VP68_9ACTO|nr:hypothetical protein [Actinomyces bovis]SPT53588.1 Uncharacterised protein [Actinomyces bovis]VEG55599.1 Uncharacterised protein [Actinomyces israelii]